MDGVDDLGQVVASSSKPSLSTTQLPRLPLEIIEQIVSELTLPSIYGDPRAGSALAALACTNRMLRQCALQARHAIAVAPRHVRDFRRWIKRVGNDMPGYCRALFVALDDVSKLTSMSAGWDVELIRMLQRLGPHLTHLSLWTSETQALLRDPAQIRGPRVRRAMGTLSDITTVANVMEDNARRRQKVAQTLRRLERGTLVQGDDLSAVPLKSRTTHDERQTRAEIAAARERARQKMPNWLRNELQAAEKNELQKRYKAQLSAVAREYQHERDAADAQRRALAEHQGDLSHTSHENGNERIHGPDAESDSDDEAAEDDGIDLASNWACMPLRLSLCPSLPLHEHEEPLNFARMTIFVRVEELDIFVAVPAEVPRVLQIFSSLVASPIRRLRISSINASLLIVVNDVRSAARRHEQVTPNANVAGGLARVLRSTTLRSLLLDEFQGRHAHWIEQLERAIASTIAGCTDEEVLKDAESVREKQRKGSLASSLCLPKGNGRSRTDGGPLDHNSDNGACPVQVRILQSDQKHYGKLKDRRQDFLSRALCLGKDCWEANGLL